MDVSLVPLMQCVTCGQRLEVERRDSARSPGDVTEGLVTCAKGHRWPIEAGVLVFSREDALSDAWSRNLKSYAAYVASREAAERDDRDVIAPILARVPGDVSGPVLDLCTGQGALLFDLLSRLDPEVPVVSADMSQTIQTYNRRYLLERYSDRPVSFIACDATTLPFRAGALPCAVAFGLGNMLHQLPEGVNEVGRVLAEGGRFIFNHQYVAADSEGWRTVTALMHELGQRDVDYLGLEDAFLRMMRRSPFAGCEVEVTAERVGDPDRDLDSGIFPYPNEKLRELVVTAVK